VYNKLFTKILDSSIWLEPTPTRIVWVTFIACMDQDGIVQLSSVGNVANRARVTEDEAGEAITCLESPDQRNPDQDHEGRRIERVPGVGWFVINHQKYRDIVTAEMVRAGNRERAKRHRESLKNVTVTERHEKVTPSVLVSIAVAEEKKKEQAPSAQKSSPRREDERQPADNKAVITKLAFEVTRTSEFQDLGSLAELLKRRCAKLKITYDSTVAFAALKAAQLAQKGSQPRSASDFIPVRSIAVD
jgi:hypothetical protein